MREQKLKSFSAEDRVLREETKYNEMVRSWESENPWPSEQPAFKNRKSVYTAAKEAYI